jgi:L-seryl-tRNA(Ser) seleniumtransferase
LEERRTGNGQAVEDEDREPLEEIVEVVGERLEHTVGSHSGRMLNATGVFLHTNLGRAPLPATVAAAMPGLLDAYTDLELERESGRRGDRNRRAERLLQALTGAPAALVTNNNAAALVLALATLAKGREVVVSRGELVEIGGSFRIAEILATSGARLVEVGSTNRTRRADFERAIGEHTALLLKVNPSNYRITGYTESVEAEELVAIGRAAGVPVMVDEGSGLLRPHPAAALSDHASLSELMALGADLACGSGDKLLGGPQAGLLLGDRELIEACQRNPLYRALRPDRACLAALEAVLRMHLAGEALPIDRLWERGPELRRRLEVLAARCGGQIVPAEGFIGGGAAPEAPVAGEALAIAGNQRLLERLRTGETPVVAYVREGQVMFDLRTVDPDDDEALAEALAGALAGDDS